jgi:hypothetical protein
MQNSSNLPIMILVKTNHPCLRVGCHTSGCDGTHCALTGGGDSLKGGEGRSQDSRSDAPVVAEAMVTMSTVGGVSMMKTEVDQGWI